MQLEEALSQQDFCLSKSFLIHDLRRCVRQALVMFQAMRSDLTRLTRKSLMPWPFTSDGEFPMSEFGDLEGMVDSFH